MTLDLLTLGAAVHRVEVPDRARARRNVVLGRDSVADMLTVDGFLGATIGRYANRIAGGRFQIDGRPIKLATNDRGNTLHGGPEGWDKRLWTIDRHDARSATLSMRSPDGEMGYPGGATATASYTVGVDTVSIVLTATSDAPTVMNMTNHAYFNLEGEGAGTIDDHLLAVRADKYTPVDATGIPVGDHEPVDGTPFDLRGSTVLGPVLRRADDQLDLAGGIDHNFVINGAGMRTAALLTSPRTGISLEVASDQPGLQVYTGNMLGGPGRAGTRYRVGDGIALEPQLHPDTPNREGRDGWPSARLDPGETYRAAITWRFTAT